MVHRRRDTGSIARALSWIAAALLMLEAVYLVFANAELAKRLGSIARGAGLEIEYRSAYTLYPGYLHFEDLRLSSRAGSVWSLTLERANLRADVFELLARRLRITRFRGDGLDVQIGQGPAALSSAPMTAEGAAPLVRAGVFPGAPGATSEASVPSIRIEDLESSVHAIGIGRYRLAGALRASADSLIIGPAALEVGSAVLTITEGSLSQSGRPAIHPLTGRVTFHLDRQDRGESSTRDDLRSASGRADLEGEILSLGALLPIEGMSIDGGRGSLRAGIAFDHGVIAPGSEIAVMAGVADIAHEDGAIMALPHGLTALARGPGPDRPALHLDVTIPEIVLQGSGREAAHDTLTRIRIELDISDADLAARRGGGAVRATVARGRLRVGDTILLSTVSAALELQDTDVLSGEAQLHAGKLDASDVVVEPGGTPRGEAQMDGQIDIKGGALSISDGLSFTGSMKARGSDASALLDLAGIAGSARWALGLVERQPFTLDGSIARRPDTLALEGIAFDSGPIQGRGALYDRGHRRAGAFLIGHGRLSVGVSIEGDHVGVVLSPEASWLERRIEAIARP